ncbi:hypothetical protein HYW76_00590 [Candidatus Pacearchaeota archaeon]|nr:hypothetical protein [Candidatus Pacearchaeota archaeon]
MTPEQIRQQYSAMTPKERREQMQQLQASLLYHSLIILSGDIPQISSRGRKCDPDALLNVREELCRGYIQRLKILRDLAHPKLFD